MKELTLRVSRKEKNDVFGCMSTLPRYYLLCQEMLEGTTLEGGHLCHVRNAHNYGLLQERLEEDF